MDHDIGVKLTAVGIQSFAMYGEDQHTIDGLHTGAFVWGGEHFHKMVQALGLSTMQALAVLLHADCPI
eukprot:scaffold277268_cov48-Prasinocladus_malaysianus.AAC.1